MCRVKKLDATGRYFWMTLPLYYDWPYWSLEWTRDINGDLIITRWINGV